MTTIKQHPSKLESLEYSQTSQELPKLDSRELVMSQDSLDPVQNKGNLWINSPNVSGQVKFQTPIKFLKDMEQKVVEKQ